MPLGEGFPLPLRRNTKSKRKCRSLAPTPLSLIESDSLLHPVETGSPKPEVWSIAWHQDHCLGGQVPVASLETLQFTHLAKYKLPDGSKIIPFKNPYPPDVLWILTLTGSPQPTHRTFSNTRTAPTDLSSKRLFNVFRLMIAHSDMPIVNALHSSASCWTA